MRGRLSDTQLMSVIEGWIPAGAGETSRRPGGQRRGRVDPRGCGGDASRRFCASLFGGGSPRVRGRQARTGRRRCGRGWIPAGAGETRTAAPPGRRRRVDPRGCGGDITDALLPVLARGGSPRVRGRRRDPPGVWRRAGWIPAGAGETADPEPSAALRGVDPRGCGGDGRRGRRRRATTGGSPRVRGRQFDRAYPQQGRGWIPAGAGETLAAANSQRNARVDPRGCGGDCVEMSALLAYEGGSPRVRGRPRADDPGHLRRGWIPAGAGETLGLRIFNLLTISKTVRRECF